MTTEKTPPTGEASKPAAKRTRTKTTTVTKRSEASTVGVFFAGFILAMIIFLIAAYLIPSTSSKELEGARNEVATLKVASDKAKTKQAEAEKKQTEAESELKKLANQTPATTPVGSTASTVCCATQCCTPPAKKPVQRYVQRRVVKAQSSTGPATCNLRQSGIIVATVTRKNKAECDAWQENEARNRSLAVAKPQNASISISSEASSSQQSTVGPATCNLRQNGVIVVSVTRQNKAECDVWQENEARGRGWIK